MKDAEKADREILELERKLAIDEFDLGSCLREQAGLYYHVARAHADATAQVDTLKLEISQLQATLDKDVREKAAKKSEKLTEGAVANRIKADEDMQDLQAKLLDATKQAARWGALREGYQQRSYMLRQLVDLAVREAFEQGEADRADRKVRQASEATYSLAKRRVERAREGALDKRRPPNVNRPDSE